MDHPRDRKKLQIMTYAFMLKAKEQFKDVKFRNLDVMYVADKYTATHVDKMRKVDVQDYLEMIKLFLKDKTALKEAGINENIYDELIKKSPKLFDVSEYTFEYNNNPDNINLKDDLIANLSNGTKSPEELASSIMIELTRIIGKAPVIVDLGKNRYTDLKEEDRKRAMYLTNQLIQLVQDPNIAMTINPDLDVSVISGWIGNYSELSIPQLQAWKKFRDDQDYKRNLNTLRLKSDHDSYLRKVLDEYYKSNPSLIRNKRYMNFNNYKKIYEFMYKDEEYNGGVRKRLKIESDEEWNSLTQTQKNYITFLNNHYKSYFKGSNAFMNQISTYVPEAGNYKPISNIDLFNKELKNTEKFEYYEGWFPKAPKEQSEIIYDAGQGEYLRGLLNPNYLKDLVKRSTTYFYENNFQGRNHASMVLPLQYLGNQKINDSEHYTLNAEFQFDKFTTSIEYKKYMDPVYAFGEGLRMWMDMQKDKNQPIYSRSSQMFEKKLISDVLGRTIRPKIVRKPIKFFASQKDEDQEIRADALLMLLKNWSSATLMWLKPFTGGGNGLNASMLLHKDALKGDISSIRLFGVEEDAIDYRLSDVLYADKTYFGEHIKNSITGNIEKDKTWLMLRKLRYLPDNFDYMSSEKYLLSSRNKWVSESSLYMFHRIPEEFVSMTTMIAQLHYLKHPTEVDENGKKKSLWDCYKVKQMENGEWDVVWDAKPRGLLKEGTGDKQILTPINDITSHEIAKLKKVYERMQGGYRKEEATAMEAYVMGKVFMNLKKYYPRLLLNAFGSKKYEMDMGYLKKTNERKEGEDIYVWMQRMNEGRFRIMGKMFISLLRGSAGNSQYKWENMDPLMKQHMVDAALTIGIWFVGYIGYMKMFGDDKDDDSLKMWYRMYAMDNFIQQYSPKELLKIGVQGMSPVPFTRALQTVTSLGTMMGAGWDYSFGDQEEAFTNAGDFRGWNQFKKSVPFVASYADFIRRIENSEDLTNILQWEKFSKWR